MEQSSSFRVRRNLAFALVVLLVVMATGTVGYHILGGERYSWLDCLYMTFITITTIGYTEVVDVTGYEYGRLFTIFIGITGIAVLGYVLSTVTAFMLESDLNTSWRRKKMRQKIEQLQGHYIVWASASSAATWHTNWRRPGGAVSSSTPTCLRSTGSSNLIPNSSGCMATRPITMCCWRRG